MNDLQDTQPTSLLVQVSAREPLPSVREECGIDVIHYRACMTASSWTAVKATAEALVAQLATGMSVSQNQFRIVEGSVVRSAQTTPRCDVLLVGPMPDGWSTEAINALMALSSKKLAQPDLYLVEGESDPDRLALEGARAARPLIRQASLNQVNAWMPSGESLDLPGRLAPLPPRPTEVREGRGDVGILMGYNRKKRLGYFSPLQQHSRDMELVVDEELLMPRVIELANAYPQQVEITFREIARGPMVVRELLKIEPMPHLQWA